MQCQHSCAEAGGRILALALLLALAACSDGNAARSPVPGSYVLVTQSRPASVEKFFARQRGLYDTCVAVASLQDAAPTPFPVLPRDLVDWRTTYASDGQRLVVREVMYGLDFDEGAPAGTCAMRLSSRLSVTVTSQGREQTSDVDARGKVHIGAPRPAGLEPMHAARLARYTVPMIVNGVPLKCSAEDSCIVDPAVVLVAQGPLPVQASSRDDAEEGYGTVLILEPVSLAVGQPVDPALFDIVKAG
ncbi:hypothetical protein [Massilia sp. S19_KUP03_FR1]|uniref:hypothetical protein n=1 Tax=Massilia sp. S19_KUP03_FR1 TaxID=3025503 RepID=UPI002FCD4135